MGISTKTHKMLWGRFGSICAKPDCRRPLVEDETETDDASIVGDEAHIVAREVGGPRGNSTLTVDERDKFENLLLMCKACHKLIDDQPSTYTVEKLHKWKEDHLKWVKERLSPDDIEKQKDDETYAVYIDKWVELADIDNWQNWTYGIFSGRQKMSVKQLDKLEELNEYILSRAWPKRYDKINFAFNNFRIVLADFINIFSMHKEEAGDNVYTKRFDKELVNWDKEIDRELSEEFCFHVDLVMDLALELTRAANYLCDQIRKYLSSSFRIKEGILLVLIRSDTDFSGKIVKLDDRHFIEYPGLKIFMESRKERDYCFGEGVHKKYS